MPGDRANTGWWRRDGVHAGRGFAALVAVVAMAGALLSGCGTAPMPSGLASAPSPATASTASAPTSASAQPSLADADDEGAVDGDAPVGSEAPGPDDAPPAGGARADTVPGEPNAALTPGAFNPDVTQATIGATICTPGWTKTVRPPSSYTTGLKVQQMAEYGYADTRKSSYEEDHLVPLELGGAPADPANLWPEPYTASLPDGTDTGAHVKDRFEDELKADVCSGAMTLAEARQRIGVHWVHWVHWRYGLPTAAASGAPPAAPASAAPAESPSPMAPKPPPAVAGSGSLAVRFTSLPNPARRGAVAGVEAKTSTGAACTARVTWPSGTVSRAKGLQPTLTAGASGLVGWTWNVSSTTKPGTSRATVTCRLGAATGSATAAFPLR